MVNGVLTNCLDKGSVISMTDSLLQLPEVIVRCRPFKHKYTFPVATRYAVIDLRTYRSGTRARLQASSALMA
jgi:hypothetical protein